MKKGLDVSHFQGLVDWSDVHNDGYDFAFVKATENLDFLDPQFVRNWGVLPTRLSLRGAYHFAHPESDMAAQGNYFANTVGELAPTDIVFVDIEAVFATDDVDQKKDLWLTFDQHTRELKLNNFLEAADAQFTKLSNRPITTGIYTDAGNWNTYFSSNYDHSGRLLWLAAVQSTPPKPIGQWKKVSYWQYSWNGTVNGIESKNSVDLDYMLD